MTSGHLVSSIVICAFLLSSCKKDDTSSATHSPRFEAINAEGLAETRVEDPASLEVHGGRSNPLSTSRASAQPLAGLGRHTPTESPFVTGKALDVPLIGRAFQGKWPETVQKLRADSVADQDATELTRAYERQMNETLGQFDGLRLKEFACGITLCAGTIVSADKTAYAQWHEGMLSMNQPPVYSFVDMEVQAPDSTEHRFAFSSDETAPDLSGQL